MAKNVMDHRCAEAGCQAQYAPWGYHDRFYCRDHRHIGESLMRATGDSMGGPGVPAQGIFQAVPAAQGRLI